MTGAAILTVVIVLAPLVAIFGYLVYRGIGSINWAFLTQIPKPVGEVGGGMANAIVGSVLILASPALSECHSASAPASIWLSLDAIVWAAPFALPPMC